MTDFTSALMLSPGPAAGSLRGPLACKISREDKIHAHMQAYTTLEERVAHISSNEDAIGILQRDIEPLTPEGAADDCFDQLATLKGIAHELLTPRDPGDLPGQADADILPGRAMGDLSLVRLGYAALPI